MGQQQLLLLVVGIIVVAVAVVVGLQIFESSAAQANVDGVRTVHLQLQMDATGFYNKPASLGGGGYTFTGYPGPGDLASVNGYTTSVAVGAQSCIFSTVLGNGQTITTSSGTPDVITHKITWTSTSVATPVG